MAQTTEWLPAIWNYMKKVKSSISMVYGQFSQMNSYSQQENLTLWAKTKPTTEPPTSAFFLDEARVHSFFWAVMSKLENLVRGLSNKVDGIQKDLDKLFIWENWPYTVDMWDWAFWIITIICYAKKQLYW